MGLAQFPEREKARGVNILPSVSPTAHLTADTGTGAYSCEQQQVHMHLLPLSSHLLLVETSSCENQSQSKVALFNCSYHRKKNRKSKQNKQHGFRHKQLLKPSAKQQLFSSFLKRKD